MADFDVPEYKNNSHWVLPDGGAAEDSNYVCYYDAASLYPSSGKTKFVFLEDAPFLARIPTPPPHRGLPARCAGRCRPFRAGNVYNVSH